MRVRSAAGFGAAIAAVALLAGCGPQTREDAAAQVLVAVDGRGNATVTVIDNLWGSPPAKKQKVPPGATKQQRALIDFGNAIGELDFSNRPYSGRIRDAGGAASRVGTLLFGNAARSRPIVSGHTGTITLHGLGTRRRTALPLADVRPAIAREGIGGDAEVYLAVCVNQDRASLVDVDNPIDRSGGCAGWFVPTGLHAAIAYGHHSRLVWPAFAVVAAELVVIAAGALLLYALRRSNAIAVAVTLLLSLVALLLGVAALHRLSTINNSSTLGVFGADLDGATRRTAGHIEAIGATALSLEALGVLAAVIATAWALHRRERRPVPHMPPPQHSFD